MGAVGEVRQLTEQGQERKQQLLDCAAELFAERGYTETRVIDIVRAAGVAKGLFYWYFENKEALFTEMVATTRAKLVAVQREAIQPDADPLTQLRQGTVATVRFMADHAPVYAVMQATGYDRDVPPQGRADQQVTATARLIKEGIAAGLVRDEDPVLLAHGVVGAVGYYTICHRNGYIRLANEELAEVVGDFVVRAVAAPGEPDRPVGR